MSTESLITIPSETILRKIFLIRGKRVMLDSDLAHIYKVLTKDLKRAVRRNASRFPDDFMFQLTKEEFENLRWQFGTSSWGGTRYMPYVFTEQGVSMLSTILNSEQAIRMNIQIIRTFTKLREILADNKKLAEKVEKMERKYDKHIFEIFEVLKRLTLEKSSAKGPMGFRRG